MCNRNGIGRVTEVYRKVVFEWEITDFPSYTEENAQYFSPDFQVLSSTWHMGIYPNRTVTDSSVNYVSLYLYKHNNKTPKTAELTFAVKNVNGNFEYKKRKGINFTDQRMYIGWDTYIERFRLLINKDDLVPSGTLTVACLIRAEEEDFDARPDKLVEDLKSMFRLKKNSDVLLKIKEDTISAHKAILAARSSVFAAMFENEMEEKKTGIVNITDCDLEPFNVFLHYVYTGEVEFSKCDVFHLYKIADKYCVLQLKVMCIDYMIRNLTLVNIFETYIFGKQFDEDKILVYTQRFFNRNFSKIVFLDVWKLLLNENPDLANNLLQGMAFKINMVED